MDFAVARKKVADYGSFGEFGLMMTGIRDKLFPLSGVLLMLFSGRVATGAALLPPEKSSAGSVKVRETDHWSFKTPQRPAIQKVKNQKWGNILHF